jgi:hypothetical protein
VSFSVLGWGLDPHDLTRQAGAIPDRVFMGRPGVAEPAWCIELQSTACRSMNEAVAPLLDRVWPIRERLQHSAKSIDPDVEFQLSCTIHVFRERPLYDLSASTIARLASLQASVILDILDYSSSEID